MMGANQFGYRYDPIGNRIASTNNAEAFGYAANSLNQYTSIVDGGTVVPTYDDDGNMTGFGTWTYTWDGENRLAIATDGSTAVTNGYDSMSRRVAKGTASETRRFVYDAWNPVRETVDAGGTLSTNFYVWGLDLSQSLQGAGGVGGLLSVVRGDAPYFTGYDANGNVTDYVSVNGTTVAHYEFDPFGNTTAATGSMADAFAHRFSTKYWDSETALYYYGLRFYRPDLGRWPSRDPIAEHGGVNINALNGNQSLSRHDALGLSWWNCCDECSELGKKRLRSITTTLVSAQRDENSPSTTEASMRVLASIHQMEIVTLVGDVVGGAITGLSDLAMVVANTAFDEGLTGGLEDLALSKLHGFRGTLAQREGATVFVRIDWDECKEIRCIIGIKYKDWASDFKWKRSDRRGTHVLGGLNSEVRGEVGAGIRDAMRDALREFGNGTF